MGEPFLSVESSTWDKDLGGLFDYESFDCRKQELSITGSGSLNRSLMELSFKRNCGSNKKSVVQVHRLGQEYIISPLKSQPLGIALNFLMGYSQPGYKLSEGDCFMIGKVLINVRSIKNEASSDQLTKSSQEILREKYYCRICLSKKYTHFNPLVSICSCSGGSKYTHVKCWQEWLYHKALKRLNTYASSYAWKSFECDICKSKLSNPFRYQGVLYNLIDLPLPSINYIILEEFRTNYSCILHILHFGESPISIGRDSNNDLSINDNSVSRTHALITHNDGFYLSDRNSKFGTVVLLNKPVIAPRNEPIVLQAGRSILKFQLKTSKKKECCACCFDNEVLLSDDFLIKTQSRLNLGN